MLLLIAAATHFSGSGNLDNIKSKTVGDGQHGTARWANRKEIQQTYRHIPFHVSEWRSGKNLPKKLFSIYPTTQECDIIVGQKGVETDEKKLSK